MVQDRQTYRKKLSSTGSVYIAGEVLGFKCQDVSAKGTLIELIPGKLIASLEDVQSVIKENPVVDIFIQELQITGSSKIVWVKSVNNKILVGLEFGDEILHAEKLWRQRRTFRKEVTASGQLIIEQSRLDFECRNISADGLVVAIDSTLPVSSGMVVEIESEPLELKGIATVIWVKPQLESEDSRNTVGLRYLKTA